MHRNLEFRVWAKEAKRWLEIHSFCTRDDGIYPFGISSESVVVQQFTGLYDKDNRKIFEGDVVKFDISGVPHGPEREIGEIGEVWFDPEFGCWSFGVANGGYSLFDRIDKKSLKVIGNIFENSNLIK